MLDFTGTMADFLPYLVTALLYAGVAFNQWFKLVDVGAPIERTVVAAGLLLHAWLLANDLFVSGSINISSGNSFTVNNGNAGGFDLVVNGSLNNTGNLSYGVSATGQMVGDYYHQINGGTIPVFTWDPSSVTARCPTLHLPRPF